MELEEKSFGEGSGGDDWGVKRLDEGEGLGGDRRGSLGGGGDFGEVGAQEAIVVEVSDNFGGGDAQSGFGEGEGELGGEVIGEGFGGNF